MKQKYFKNLSLFFSGIFLITIAGFSTTYFGHLSATSKFPFIVHLHATAFVLWFLLLITQPLLIGQNKIRLHRLLGKISFLLVPILILTAMGMTKIQYHRELSIGKLTEPEILKGIAKPILDILLFGTFYLVAIAKVKKLHLHIAFIVGTSFLLLEPGLARFIPLLLEKFGESGILVILAVYYIPLIIWIIYQKIKLKINVLKNPYLLILIILLTKDLVSSSIGETVLWQNLMQKIVTVFY